MRGQSGKAGDERELAFSSGCRRDARVPDRNSALLWRNSTLIRAMRKERTTTWATRLALPIYQTGFQKIAQVLSDALLRNVAPAGAGQSRKLVVFSDSRQDAAKLSAGMRFSHYRDALRQAIADAVAVQGAGAQSVRGSVGWTAPACAAAGVCTDCHIPLGPAQPLGGPKLRRDYYSYLATQAGPLFELIAKSSPDRQTRKMVANGSDFSKNICLPAPDEVAGHRYN